MAIHPDSRFPVIASDQADVIRVFLDLMSERERAERAPRDNGKQPVGPGSDSYDGWTQGQLPDFEA